ncbi:response regulator [Paenibacillus sp. GCM10027626]|uniref:response regulator transcription factor n=1 Tax=Paenibacillus sp. GCM10027626 TaxID=3273411 RepID=UPI003626F02A
MLKAMLVDDEINILRNLQVVIPWEEIGFEVIGLAGNGVVALEMAQEFQPDLILTDIRMPVMDGIALIGKLRELKLECECIMLSGYQDFEYARSVMRYGVKEYMLKPIDYDELQQVVRRAAETIRAKRKQASYERRKWGNFVSVAYEKILYDVLMDYTSVLVHPLLAAEGVCLEELEFALLLVDLNHFSPDSGLWNDQDRKLCNFAIRNVLAEVLAGESRKCAVLQMREGEWCLLIEHRRGESEYGAEQAREWSERVYRAVLENIKLNVSIGVYPRLVSAEQLSAVYKNVQQMIALAPEEGLLVASAGSFRGQDELTAAWWNLTEGIVSGLKQCSRRQTEEALHELNRHLMTLPDDSMRRIQQVLHFLVLHLLREMREIAVLTQTDEEALWSKIGHCTSPKELLSLINELINQCLQSVEGRKSRDVLMMAAKDYIDKRLADNLSVEEVADYLRISSGYFSLLFKQHFGMTYVEYLTKLRMETAKSLLVTSDRYIAQIGEMVGYVERRYFTKVFLKYTGMTPSEYRESNREAAKQTERA